MGYCSLFNVEHRVGDYLQRRIDLRTLYAHTPSTTNLSRYSSAYIIQAVIRIFPFAQYISIREHNRIVTGTDYSQFTSVPVYDTTGS